MLFLYSPYFIKQKTISKIGTKEARATRKGVNNLYQANTNVYKYFLQSFKCLLLFLQSCKPQQLFISTPFLKYSMYFLNGRWAGRRRTAWFKRVARPGCSFLGVYNLFLNRVVRYIFQPNPFRSLGFPKGVLLCLRSSQGEGFDFGISWNDRDGLW